MDSIQKLLGLLNERSVRYVIIGATAFAAHGWVRATGDLDLFVDPDAENIARLRSALVAFGYDIEAASAEDFARFKILLRQYDLPLGIHPFVAGVRSFDEVWWRRLCMVLGSVTTNCVSLDDLIVMKQAAGREKDKLDLIRNPDA